MSRFSLQPREWTYVKGYGFLSQAKNIGNNKNKNVSGKCIQNLLDHAKQTAIDGPKATR